MQPGEEVALEIEAGKTLYIKLIAISATDTDGMKTIFFELNGHPRDVKVNDKSDTRTAQKRPKADPENLHHLGSPMPGRVVQVLVKPGQDVAKGDTVVLLEAMKMETTVIAPRSGGVGEIHVASGEIVDAGDLIMVYK